MNVLFSLQAKNVIFVIIRQNSSFCLVKFCVTCSKRKLGLTYHAIQEKQFMVMLLTFLVWTVYVIHATIHQHL